MGSVIYISKKDSPVFCPKYGLLYNWYAATDVRNIANEDWSVPTRTQLTILNSYLGSLQGEKLKEVGTTYWVVSGGTNSVGFNARGNGIRSGTTGTFTLLQNDSRIWSSTVYTGTASWFRWLQYTSTGFAEQQDNNDNGNIVRLIKNTTILSNGQTGTYTGNDGRVYHTICIGTQEWLADNLMETKFRNGDIIPWYGANPSNYFTNLEWAALTTAGMCAYDNDVSNVGCDFTFPPIEPVIVFEHGWYGSSGAIDLPLACSLLSTRYDTWYTYASDGSMGIGTKFYQTRVGDVLFNPWPTSPTVTVVISWNDTTRYAFTNIGAVDGEVTNYAMC